MSAFERIQVESPLALDLILWRRYRRKTPGLAEQALALNPGLAAAGPLIPAGTVITLPVLPAQAPPARRALVRLWD